MDGRPEGSAPTTAGLRWRRPRWQLVVGVTFLAYLLFRAGQGAIWLIHHL